ncbi:MAG: hypothetical protein Q3M30_11085 [Candidatus Electrothrix sp. Rat3]|nr:hypothetical protein [Candidatus Electrothrix rattekaaiensis]
MAGYKKKKWKGKEAAGTYIHREVYESKAFLALKGAAPQVLIIIFGKRYFDTVDGKKICTNCNSLSFTYIEAKEKYGITQPRLTRAIDELLAKGFITVKHPGGAYQQDKTIYGLSDQWKIWIPGKVVEERIKDTRQRGFIKAKKEPVTG